MRHQTARAYRPGCGWQSRCRCGWKSEWTADVVEARADGRAHEAQPDPVDWSVPESWLRQR
jgi:hypothetical protein